jgi:hypothetical protein
MFFYIHKDEVIVKIVSDPLMVFQYMQDIDLNDIDLYSMEIYDNDGWRCDIDFTDIYCEEYVEFLEALIEEI